MSGPRTPPRETPDDGPILDTGPSEIEIERREAGVDTEDDEGTAIPPEAELPPD